MSARFHPRIASTEHVVVFVAVVMLALAPGCSSDADGGTGTATDAGASDGQGGADAGGTSGGGSSSGGSSSGADAASTDGGSTSSADASSSGGASSSSGGSSGGASSGGGAKLYAVGMITLQTKGAGGRTLPTNVWYPINAGQKGEVVKYLQGLVASPYGALKDAKPAPGKFPLIAFSHGNQGVPDQSVFLTEAYARHGYVVVSAAHVNNTTLDNDPTLACVMTLWRPQDLKAAIDRIANPEKGDPAWLKDLVDTTKVAVTGHSFGGYTSLAVAGIKVDEPPLAAANCGALPPTNPYHAEKKKLGAKPWDFGDKRVKVVIPLAHAMYAYRILQHASAKTFKVPAIIMAATGDSLTTFKAEAEPLYKDLPGEAALFAIQGGEHMSFANICEVAAFVPPNLKAGVQKLCNKAAKPTILEQHAAIVKYSVAAADIYLKGDDTKRKLFKPAQNQVYELKSKGITK